MRTDTAPARLTASLLCVVLASCGAARHLAPASAQELTRHVLFIREQPDGTVSHSWQRAEEVDLSPFRRTVSTRGAARHIVLAMGHKRDCDEEHRECMRECMSRPLPRGFGHMTSGNRGKGAKENYCRDKCRQALRDCAELERLKPQEFTAIDSAVDWLKRNRQSILVGSVVIVAGVAFVVVSAGVGLVILAPAVLLAAPSLGAESHMAEVSP